MFMKLIFSSGSKIPFIFICLSICSGYMLISGGGASTKSSCGRVPSRSWSDSKNDMYNDFSLFTVIQHQIPVQNLMYNVKFCIQLNTYTYNSPEVWQSSIRKFHCLPPQTSASFPRSCNISMDFPANTTSKITGSKNSGAQWEEPTKFKCTCTNIYTWILKLQYNHL